MERLNYYARRPSATDITFGRSLSLIALAKLDNAPDTGEFAKRKMHDYRDRDDVVDAIHGILTKAAVPGLESDSGWAPSLSSVAQGIGGESVLARIPRARKWIFREQLATASALAAGAAFRPAGRAIKVSPVSFAGVSLHRYSVAGLAVASREVLELAIKDNTGAETLSALLRDAVRRELDSVFCDGNAATPGERPAGIAADAQVVSSTGATATAIAADVRSMIDVMVSGGVSVRSACWIVSSEAFALLSTLKILDGNGSTLAGRPVVSDAPSGVFALLAADYLTFAQSDQVEISTATSGMVEMSDAPAGDTVEPVASSASRISLFQTDSVALRASLDVDWALTGPEDSNGFFAAVTLTGSTFA